MKVWRGFTLTLWVVLLTACAVFAIHYHVLQTTVLDQQKTTTWLAGSSVYDAIRDQLIAPEISDTINQKVPDNRLIDATLVRDVTADILPRQEVEQRIQPVVNAIYRWLDSKEPGVNFSVSFADKKDAFYQSLEKKLSAKITSIESCTDTPYPPEDALLKYLCLPSYVTANEATQAVMGYVRASDIAPDTTVSADSFTLPSSFNNDGIKQLPTYLNMAWALNWLAIAVFAFLALFVIITRRAVGVMALGVSLLLAGLLVFASVPTISHLTFSAPDGIAKVASEIVSILIPKITRSETLYALGATGIGIALVGLGILWQWLRRKRRA